MRTFAQKQNQPQKLASSSLVKAKMTTPEQDQSKEPFLHLPRATSGNRGGQRMLQTTAEERKAGLNAPASPLVGHDFSRIPIHSPPGGVIQTKPLINKPSDTYEQEADRVADKIINIPEALPSITATSTSAVIQRKPGDADEAKTQSSLTSDDKKAELEFHSTIAFNHTNSGSRSTGPSEEGFTGLEMQWTVWNSGWEIAPEHIDRVTMYQADRCSGCRAEKDEILRMEVPAPATVPITQPGDGAFKYEAISPTVGMTLRAGHYDVYVDLDVYDEVQEINEDNNTIFTTFFVKPRRKPDLEEEAA